MADRGVLPKEGLALAERLEICRIEGRGPFNATSIDIGPDILFRQREGIGKITEDTPLEDIFEVYEPYQDKWLLEPNGFYIARRMRRCYKARGFLRNITSRSSWARYGIECRHVTDYKEDLAEIQQGPIDFSINTLNTSVILRKGDLPAQLRFAYENISPVYHDVLERLENREMIAEGAELKRHGFTLSADSGIWVYTGETIDPREDSRRYFREADISKGYDINEGVFYIASSSERVRVPKEFIGFIHATDYSGQEQYRTEPSGFATQKLHSNAPFIDPYPHFEGKVTFENLPLANLRIEEGMRLTELQLIPLLLPYEPEEGIVSRYKGQDRAQTSKGESEQLDLFK